MQSRLQYLSFTHITAVSFHIILKKLQIRSNFILMLPVLRNYCQFVDLITSDLITTAPVFNIFNIIMSKIMCQLARLINYQPTRIIP